ncbi:8914_t:CDS:1, partial [Cetraspora pellucida]
NFRKTEIYKRLYEEKLIDPKIHTYNQIYYWALKFSAQQYVIYSSNQLLSFLNFLKQEELVNEGFKVIVYIKNNFVQALRFLTPFNSLIQKADINEIIIDSTYKTSNQKFELFS